MRTITGIDDFVLHDLRRTAATLMTKIGTSRLVVSKILNHVESGVTKVYDRHGYEPENQSEYRFAFFVRDPATDLVLPLGLASDIRPITIGHPEIAGLLREIPESDFAA